MEIINTHHLDRSSCVCIFFIWNNWNAFLYSHLPCQCKKFIATAINVDVGKVKLAPNPQNSEGSSFNSFFLRSQQVWSRNLHFAWHVSGQISILGLNRKKLCMYSCIASILIVNIYFSILLARTKRVWDRAGEKIYSCVIALMYTEQKFSV